MSLTEEIAKAEKEAEHLRKIAEAFPDVRKHVNRWKNVFFCSKSVNPKVERFLIKHNCGCCSDSPLEIWPYLETPVGNIFSEPPVFVVGEKDMWAGGDRPNPGWKEPLQAAGIPEDIIGAVSMHFKRCRDSVREHADSLEDGDG